MADQHKLASEMKDQIAGAVKEKEKIAEGKAEFDKKKPDMFKEIQAKAKEKEKFDEAVAQGKADFDKKKPEMFKEIQAKVEKK